MDFRLLLPFAVVAVFHLVSCFVGWGKCRAISKPFLMPLLLAGCLLGTDAPVWLAAAGLGFGFLGDSFLLAPGRNWSFLAGLGSFLFGHICYIAAFAQKIAVWPSAPALVLWALGFAAIAVIAFWSIKEHLGKMTAPTVLYLLVIAAMAFFAVSYALSESSPLALAALPGGLLFLSSDYLLARQIFVKNFARGNFWVMLTYLLAQTGIALAIMG